MSKFYDEDLRYQWINAAEDIGGKCRILAMDHLPDNLDYRHGADIMHRPRRPLEPGHSAAPLIDDGAGSLVKFEPLEALYQYAYNDLEIQERYPETFYVYSLVQAGMVQPGQTQRADFWHVDLERLQRQRHMGMIPVAINYTVSTDTPTEFVTKLPDNLPALKTAGNRVLLHDLGENARKLGHIFQAQANQIVRYDTMTLHRGGQNLSDKPVYRTFMHLAFSPAGPKIR